MTTRGTLSLARSTKADRAGDEVRLHAPGDTDSFGRGGASSRVGYGFRCVADAAR